MNKIFNYLLRQTERGKPRTVTKISMKVAEGLSISTKQKKAQQKYLIVIVQNQGWLLALDCLTV